MSEIKIIESARDAWQALPRHVPPEIKAEALRGMVSAGFLHIDAVSFVAPETLPQMNDSDLVLEYLDAPEAVEIIALVANARGAQLAVETQRVTTLAFPYSISPVFLERNQRQTPEDALDQLEQIGEIAYKGGQDVVAYLAMAFGNPFGDSWDIDEVVSAVDLLVDSGVAQVVLSDTAGAATPELVGDVLACVSGVHAGLEIGVHLHPAAGEAQASVRAAYLAGCRRFDASLGGVGASPWALLGVPEVVGASNLATEELLATLQQLGAQLPDLEPLDRLAANARELARRYGSVARLV